MNHNAAQSGRTGTTDRLMELIQQLSIAEQITLLEQVEGYIAGKETEKREHGRIQCDLPVNYINLLEMVTDYANDISPSGIFMPTDAELHVGDEIFLRINFSETVNPFQIPAEVVRASSKGVGLRFQFRSQVQKAIITSLINSLKAMKQGINSSR